MMTMPSAKTPRLSSPVLLLTLAFFLALGRVQARAAEVDRSPVDLVLAPDESWLVTINQTASTASLVRTSDGRVLDEVDVGRYPTGLALLPDGKQVLISGHYAGDVRQFEIAGDKLKQVAAIDVGFQPHGIAVTADGKKAYVALTAAAQVAEIDLEKREIAARIDVGRWPRHLALAPDGKRLAVGTSGDRGVSIVDTQSQKLLQLTPFVGLNIGHMAISADSQHVYFPWMVYRNNAITQRNIQLGWVLASRIARLGLDGESRREAMSLDPPGKAIADVHGLALTSNEEQIVVSAGGTHELLVYRAEGLPLKERGSSDHIDPDLLKDSDRFFRIELGGRPLGLQIGKDDRTVYVANYLDNSVQVVDISERKLARTIALGGPKEPSLVRRGEAIFLDARRSLDQWYSCQTCHYEGGTNSVPMDTQNDGTAFTFKTVLPLHNIHETAPWTWHGWQTNLQAAMKKSLLDTMLGPLPTDEDAAAVAAYFQSLELPPNPFRNKDGSLTAAAERGKTIFESERAGCTNCHSGPYLTDGQIHDVGLGSVRDRYQGFNTPTLRGVYQKVKLLHDGRVDNLESLLTGPHNPRDVTGNGELTPAEVQDLIAYLKSL